VIESGDITPFKGSRVNRVKISSIRKKSHQSGEYLINPEKISSIRRKSHQSGENLINPEKISIQCIGTAFAWKADLRVKKKKFVWGSNQIGQTNTCKAKESDRVQLAMIQIMSGLAVH
jgi:hypothetical protein